jgi:large subunit ribosomal protein L10
MKTRETKQRDLEALTASLATSKSAMVVSFSKLTVNKDQEFRRQLREAGAKYQVVKNTLARIAVKGTDFEQATEAFKGVTAIAWTENDPVILSKAISKFMKDNADIYSFKAGVVDGKLVDLRQVTEIASLPSKEELISKLLWVLNAQAQRIVTVINAVPRDLAVVIKQIGEKDPSERGGGTTEPKADAAAGPGTGETPAPNIPEDKEAPAAEGPADAAPAEPPADANPGSESQSPSDDILEVPSATDTPVADQPDAPAGAAEEAQQSKEDRQDASAPEAQTAGEGDGGAEETKPE